IVLALFIFSDIGEKIHDTSLFEPAIDNQRSESASLSEGFTPREFKSKLINQVMPVTSIPQLLSLNAGDIFSLQGVNDNGSNEIKIAIAQYEAQDKYTQMQGPTADNGIAIITVGVETVNVFIKEASGLYEFSGKGFKGEIPRIEKIVWGDDIYIDPQPAANEEEQELAPMGIEIEQ
ncbi:MAG: hypothetical protein P8P29_09105, partial [Flavobacteriaceae bacterium]|nr:hypothetical protein [Flavobacteriaceae bacterium]